MKHLTHVHIANIFLLFPLSVLSMTTTPVSLSLEDKIRQAFAQKVAAIMQEKTDNHFKAPKPPQEPSMISTYTPDDDQDLVIVVTD